MRCRAVLAGLTAVGLAAGGITLYAGWYDISATDQHLAPTYWLLDPDGKILATSRELVDRGSANAEQLGDLGRGQDIAARERADAVVSPLRSPYGLIWRVGSPGQIGTATSR